MVGRDLGQGVGGGGGAEIFSLPEQVFVLESWEFFLVSLRTQQGCTLRVSLKLVDIVGGHWLLAREVRVSHGEPQL